MDYLMHIRQCENEANAKGEWFWEDQLAWWQEKYATAIANEENQ